MDMRISSVRYKSCMQAWFDCFQISKRKHRETQITLLAHLQLNNPFA
jgi:hypothetical protein